MQYIIGSWYRKEELAKRSCIFHTSGAIATMFSGYLMAGVYKLDGKGGFRGWQWLFIVDGIISLPIAVLGFFCLPDLPEISKPFYLTKEEVAFAQERMRLEGRQKRKPYTRAKIRKIFTSWHIWALVPLYVFFNNASMGSQPIFQQFLKASKDPKYTVSEINTVSSTISSQGGAVLTIWAVPDNDQCRASRHNTTIRLDERQYPQRLQMATHRLRRLHEHHLLHQPRNLGYPHQVEVGLLYPLRFRWRSLWLVLCMGTRDMHTR